MLQTISTLSNATVLRSQHAETTALGAAYLAGLSVGFWASMQELKQHAHYDADVHPDVVTAPTLRYEMSLWRTAVGRVCKWPASPSDTPSNDPAFPLLSHGVGAGAGEKNSSGFADV